MLIFIYLNRISSIIIRFCTIGKAERTAIKLLTPTVIERRKHMAVAAENNENDFCPE